MSQVMITTTKLDDLADAISAKSGVSTPMTVDEMTTAVSGISPGGNVQTSKSYTVSSSGNITISPDTGYNAMEAVALTVPSQTLPTSTSSSATSGYSSKATVSRSTSDQYINIPTGYNAAGAYYKVNAVANGSATPAASISGTGATVSTGTNTLIFSKTVSNTPQVTAGYISAGTAGNSSVSLTASVTTQAAQTIYPSTSDQTINSGRYLTGNQTIKGVAVSSNLTADNIKNGVTITIGDSADADRIKSVTGTYTGGGGSTKNVQYHMGSASVRTNGYTSTGISITVAKAGTYKVSWAAWRSSSSGTMGTNLYKNGNTGTNQQTWTSTYGQCITLNNQSYAAGDVLTLYATAGSTTRYCYVANLIIEEQ